MAAPSLVRNHTATITSGTTITVSVTQAAAGNLLVASIAFRSTTISPAPTITPPSGWTLQTSGYASLYVYQFIFTKLAGSGEATSYAFQISESTVAAALVYSEWFGASASSPVQDSGTTVHEYTVSTGICDAPQLTATTADCIVYLSCATVGSFTITSPSSATAIAQAESGTTNTDRRCKADYYAFNGPGSTPTDNAFDRYTTSATNGGIAVSAIIIGPAFSIVPLTVHHMRQMGMA